MGSIVDFVDRHYRHFNAASLRDAALAYKKHVDDGHKMLVTLAGAMSTAELGVSLAEMIRKEKVHSICCTGANLEEDMFNLVAHKHYKRIPNYRYLTEADDQALVEQHLNRVTDTCIPEGEAIRKIEKHMMKVWSAARKQKVPHEFFYDVILDPEFAKEFDNPVEDSWLYAAAERKLPLFVPGWEDSTLGNIFAARVLQRKLDPAIIYSGIHYMIDLIAWYSQANDNIGFFQIGGGIAGDFPICVVPLIHQDLELNVPRWGYFCQISDSTTSYGSYSGATPNEKISWGKLEPGKPSFVIESDATIVAPLIFDYVLGN